MLKPGRKTESTTLRIRSSIEVYSTTKLGEYGRSLFQASDGYQTGKGTERYTERRPDLNRSHRVPPEFDTMEEWQYSLWVDTVLRNGVQGLSVVLRERLQNRNSQEEGFVHTSVLTRSKYHTTRLTTLARRAWGRRVKQSLAAVNTLCIPLRPGMRPINDRDRRLPKTGFGRLLDRLSYHRERAGARDRFWSRQYPNS